MLPVVCSALGGGVKSGDERRGQDGKEALVEAHGNPACETTGI
jgi:hypothetical protein